MTTTDVNPAPTTDPNGRFGDPATLRALVAARKPQFSQTGALPSKLSPSRASDFKKCPQSFFYKTVCAIREPATLATLRGSLAHEAFERIFDHPQGERTPELAISYLAPAWARMTNPDLDGMDEKDAERARADAEDARAFAPAGSDAEREILEAAAVCVRDWFDMERVNNFSPTELELPDGTIIDGRELYVWADLSGVTAHGYIDRLDRYTTADGSVVWTVSDYKTSKCAPWLKNPNWHPKTVARIRAEAFFQLRIYAALLWKLYGIKVHMLRLVYVGTGDRETGIQTDVVTQQSVDNTIRELQTLWRDIKRSARTGRWATKTGPLCQWCFFHDICPEWSSDVSDIVTECQ